VINVLVSVSARGGACAGRGARGAWVGWGVGVCGAWVVIDVFVSVSARGVACAVRGAWERRVGGAWVVIDVLVSVSAHGGACSAGGPHGARRVGRGERRAAGGAWVVINVFVSVSAREATCVPARASSNRHGPGRPRRLWASAHVAPRTGRVSRGPAGCPFARFGGGGASLRG